MRTALDADRIAHGIYAWWLINSQALPSVPTAPHPVEPYGLIYLGVGPGRAGSKRALRARFSDHGKDAGRSTLRRALASLLYQQEGWRLRWTDRPLLAESDNDALTKWMDTNLRVQWVRLPDPWDTQAEIVHRMRPPPEPLPQPGASLLQRARRGARALQGGGPRHRGAAFVSDSGRRDDGVKHLTAENWSQPDETGRAFGAINSATGERRAASADGWTEQFLATELNEAVPVEIRDMWEVARGLALYGWFYYPLYAIAEHQLRRVADAAVLHRYTQAGGPPHKKRDPEGDLRWPDFKRRVEWLIANGIVAPEKRPRWDTMRDLRNETTHASIRHLVMPIDVLRLLDLLAPEIDALFIS